MSVKTILVAESLCAFCHFLLLLDQNDCNLNSQYEYLHFTLKLARTLELFINFQEICALILEFLLISEMHHLGCLFIISH
jgi:hypothetical protein